MSRKIKLNGVAISDERWYKLCDAGLGRSMPLDEADISKSFVYDRQYGLFYCNGGHHQQAMALLYAWTQGFDSAYDLLDELKIRDLSVLADKFIEEMEGTCFRSSVGKTVIAGKRKNLTVIEKRFFGEIKYIVEEH
jgi:hypothetical protein